MSKVFISWSGLMSKNLANELHSFLSKVIPGIDFFVSSADIKNGQSWLEVIKDEIVECDAAILCIYKENLESPWLNFEAGGVYFGGRQQSLYPFVFEHTDEGSRGPVSHLQSSSFSRNTLWEAVDELSKLTATRISQEVQLSFNENWPDLEKSIDKALSDPDREAEKMKKGLIAEFRTEEIKHNNKFLFSSSEAQIIALTYKSLGNTMSTDVCFPSLSKVDLYIYALPNLRLTHPTLANSNLQLENEWTTGIRRTISGFLDREKCPKLEQLTLFLVCIPPAFSGTSVMQQKDGITETRIRIHLTANGIEPEDLPTLYISSECQQQSQYVSFKKMVSQLAKEKAYPLRYALRNNEFDRKDIKSFVDCLMTVSCHPKYGPEDRMLEAYYREAKPRFRRPKMSALDTGEVKKRFQNENSQLHFDADNDSIEIIPSALSDKSYFPRPVENPHVYACFLLLVKESSQILLIQHKKGDWEYDIPGGKMTYLDTNENDCLVREIFEEIGLTINPLKINPTGETVYDPRGKREGEIPVVAQYFTYYLCETELGEIKCSDRQSTKQNPLRFLEVGKLIDEMTTNPNKVCHAPLNAFQKIKNDGK